MDRCPTPCARECVAPCHEVHSQPKWRGHEPDACPATTPPLVVMTGPDGLHDLFHPWWRCRGYPGGLRTHVRQWWTFVGAFSLRAATWCRLGQHSYSRVYARTAPKAEYAVYGACQFCFHREY